MNLELDKIVEEVKDVNYDHSDMGEPVMVYIPPMEVPLNETRHLWQPTTSRTIGGGPHRQSRNARLQKPCHDSKPAPHPPGAERQAWQASFFRYMDYGKENNVETRQSGEGSSTSAPLIAHDENARHEFPN